MRNKLAVAILFLTVSAHAGELKLVTTVPYDELQGRLEALTPGHQYGARGVALWADVQGECFEGPSDVVSLFDGWLAMGFAGHWLPRSVDLRCSQAGQQTSLGVVTETSVHGTAPNQLYVMQLSAHGGHVLQLLSVASIGGSAMVRDPYLEFILERGAAVGILYSDRRDDDGLNCWSFLRSEGFKERRFYAPSLYEVEGQGEQTFLVVTGVGPHQWAIERIGSRTEILETIEAEPRSIPANTVGPAATEQLDKIDAFLGRFSSLVGENRGVRVFDSGLLQRYADTLKQRATLSAETQSGSPRRQ
jgi:hypothetical protein